MVSIRRNVIANYAGRLWSAALGLAFPPLFLRMLGAEAYGLIGFYSSLIAVLGVLDLGLGTTLQRRLAILSAERSPSSAQQMNDVTRTFEILFWGVGAAAGLSVVMLAPIITRRWIHIDRLPVATVVDAIRVMGLIFAMQWPASLYNGALLGLQRQVEFNALYVVVGTLRSVGAALVLWKVTATIGAFFGWQVLTTALTTTSAAWIVRRALPVARAPRFRMDELRGTWRFSLGLWAISILAIGLTQIDKLTVSRLLPLADLGYYTLASSAGTAVLLLIGPVFSALFPRFCQLVGSRDEVDLRALYHRGCQMVSVVLLPVATVLSMFSREVMTAWTGNVVVVDRTWAAVTALTIGSACNAIVNLPYALQLAYGWTRLTLWTNVVAIVALLPLVWMLGSRYGLSGVAIGWAALNVGYVAIIIPLMHRRLLRGEARRWAVRDVGLPLLGALVPAVPLRLVAPIVTGRLQCLGVVVLSLLVAALGAVLAAEETRRPVVNFVSAGWRKSNAA
jgi:O-antigen/teichoic acid export membrane protein